MTLDHLGELLVGLEPLPFQARPPVVEEASRPALALAFPELAKGLLEQVGSPRWTRRHRSAKVEMLNNHQG